MAGFSRRRSCNLTKIDSQMRNVIYSRASEEDQPRIKAELDELTEQIKRQEEIVRNPKAAEEKTEKNIQSGLERERQPEKPVAGKTVHDALSIRRQGLRRIIFRIV